MDVMELPSAVHAALIDPRRALEVQGWLRGNDARQPVALAWRGSSGETMMHWAFLSSWSLALELNTLGLDYADLDEYGRTPMDWLSDRLWSSIVEPVGSVRLSLAGQERLRKHTEEQVLGLWALGVRPGVRRRATTCRGFAGCVLVTWGLLDLLKDEVIEQAQDTWNWSATSLQRPLPWLDALDAAYRGVLCMLGSWHLICQVVVSSLRNGSGWVSMWTDRDEDGRTTSVVCRGGCHVSGRLASIRS